MKTLKSTLVVLILAITFSACSKSGTNPQKAAAVVPLVTQVVTTYPNYRVVYNYTYDDKKRLSTVGSIDHNVTYNAGGFEIIVPDGSSDKLITDVTLTDGKIATVASYHSSPQYQYYNSVFSYDTNGRLVKTVQKETYGGNVIYTVTYTYTWNDDDNLIAATIASSDGDTFSVTYSGFSADNPNTLGGKNFGFDYFGTADYPEYYVPNNNGGPGAIFPGVYAGKILPTVSKSPSGTTNYAYHKNSQGYIDRIEGTSATDGTSYGVTSITYE